MPTNLTCPACGADAVSRVERDEQVDVPFAPPAHYRAVVDTCSVCGTEGDFLSENDARIEEAVDVVVRESVRNMLQRLNEAGVSMAYFERALGLPQRTLARWKGGECSSPAVALLRVVSTFPWILEVAEKGFDYSSAQQKLVEEASRTLLQFAHRSEISVVVHQPRSNSAQASWRRESAAAAAAPVFALLNAGTR